MHGQPHIRFIINHRHTVARVFETMQCSILEGIIDIFVLTKSFRPRCGLEAESDSSSKDEYHDYLLVTKGGRSLELKTFHLHMPIF